MIELGTTVIIWCFAILLGITTVMLGGAMVVAMISWAVEKIQFIRHPRGR